MLPGWAAALVSVGGPAHFVSWRPPEARTTSSDEGRFRVPEPARFLPPPIVFRSATPCAGFLSLQTGSDASRGSSLRLGLLLKTRAVDDFNLTILDPNQALGAKPA